MIQNISNYASNIITLIIIITIIELLLPNNKNKKYIMFACSLVVMLSVINPILAFLGTEIDISNSIKEMQKEIKQHENNAIAQYDLKDNIQDTYVKKLEQDMIVRLEDIGYKVIESNIVIDDISYEPIKIEMKVEYSDGEIQPIVIEVFESSSSKLSEIDINKIKNILSATYGISKEEILINE